jgi:hypothetical protein
LMQCGLVNALLACRIASHERVQPSSGAVSAGERPTMHGMKRTLSQRRRPHITVTS